MQDNEKTTFIYKWNPWIGCHKKSQGCLHCSSAQSFNGDYYQTINLDLGNFDLPLQRNKKGQYYIPQNSYIALEYNSDFFIEDMDFFRSYIWNIIKIRKDCIFDITTKRPERVLQCLPKDWGKGWNNVLINCTIENQQQANKRLPIYLDLPLVSYSIMAQPLLENLDLTIYLKTKKINIINVEGEFITKQEFIYLARPCKYQWVKNLYEQCKIYNTNFAFTLTGSRWINEKNKEEIISPYGWDMRDRAEQYNLKIGNLFKNNTTNYYNFKYINKEE